MAVVVKNKNGKDVTLLNPSEKTLKYCVEMDTNQRVTNNGEVKQVNGNTPALTKEQRAYRAGYIAHAKDSQKCFRASHPKVKRKTQNVSTKRFKPTFK